MPEMVKAVTSNQSLEFLADDIILASSPKTSTTWLKALLFTIINRQLLATDDPLLTHNLHLLVPCLEFQTLTHIYDLSSLPDFANKKRRVFATHLPYQLLPESIKNSSSSIVCVARNPRDTFVSMWHFTKSIKGVPIPMEDGFDKFCRGISPVGPFFDHDLKENPRKQLKELAEFLGCALHSDEEVDEIVWRCSYDWLSNLDINKNSKFYLRNGLPVNSFFRRGVVDDWKNYLTDEMIEGLDRITCEKLEGSGLQFQVTTKASIGSHLTS